MAVKTKFPTKHPLEPGYTFVGGVGDTNKAESNNVSTELVATPVSVCPWANTGGKEGMVVYVGANGGTIAPTDPKSPYSSRGDAAGYYVSRCVPRCKVGNTLTPRIPRHTTPTKYTDKSRKSGGNLNLVPAPNIPDLPV